MEDFCSYLLRHKTQLVINHKLSLSLTAIMEHNKSFQCGIHHSNIQAYNNNNHHFSPINIFTREVTRLHPVDENMGLS